ncbi:hypothetical protein PO909_017264 [Leuciscus waleckii]
MHLYSASQRLMVMICLVAFLCAFTSGVISHDPKRPICCKEDTLTFEKPSIKITKCYIFPAKGKCAAAVGSLMKINCTASILKLHGSVKG